MQNSIFHKLSDFLWAVLIVVLVLLAIYVSVGRLLTNNISSYRAAILQELNVRVPFNIEAQAVTGRWRSFAPDIVLSGLRLTIPGLDHAPIELSEGRIGLDVLNSLRTRSLQVTRIALSNLNLQGELTADGRFRLTGFAGGGGEMGEWVQEFLLNAEHISLQDNLLQLRMPNGELREFDLDLQLTRQGSRRRVDGNLYSTSGMAISVIGQGLGNPFAPQDFSGELYLGIRSSDLAAVRDLLAGGPPPLWAEGALDLQLWLDWHRGDTTIESRVEASNLMISDAREEWQVPLERIALRARLEEHRKHWRVHATDLQLDYGTGRFSLPRLQLDIWEGASRLRAADISLAPLSALFTGIEAVPANLREVFDQLQPRGTASALQINVGDYDNPARDWELEANFSAVAVNSWRGAPGVVGARGHVELDSNGGTVVLDSEDISLEFPTVYREPLRYFELYGNIDMDWDNQRFNLHSGLLTATGEEGTASVLFGLNVPLVDSVPGIEMDLLVGLSDSHPQYRGKYLPYTLNPGLLDWLQNSIGEGRIEEGAFLWRGSLRKGAGELRTVQLAFNVEDTQLEYDPRWPPVEVESGVVLIDNTRVSVWSDRARIYGSDARALSVETRVAAGGGLLLDVRGQIDGPAADGLRVVNESPLTDVVGTAFNRWRVQGELQADLKLRLNLTDKQQPPWVEVATTWRDVSMQIQPGNLPLEGVNGQFNYSTHSGFSSTDLQARLWGETVSAELIQHHGVGPGGYDPARSGLEIAVKGDVELASVRDWLQLQPLAFADGDAQAAVSIVIAPGRSPALSVTSDLEGVTLDAPPPYDKAAESTWPLRVHMPLGGDVQRLAIDLGEILALELALANGSLEGASLAFGATPSTIVPGQIQISGEMDTAPLEPWLNFITRYFAPQAAILAGAVEAATAADPNESTALSLAHDSASKDVEATAETLAFVIDNLLVREFDVYGRSLTDVALSLRLAGPALALGLTADWLEAEFSLAPDGSPARLNIVRLDLAGMPELALSNQSEESAAKRSVREISQGGEHSDESAWSLPDTEVSVLSLLRDEQTLGSVAFTFSERDDSYVVSDLQGELYGFRIADDPPAQLHWSPGAGGSTRLRGAALFANLGESLTALGYQPIVDTSSGEVEVDLRWPGGPDNFSLLQGQGSLRLQIADGSFPQAPAGASGAVRVVSILNLVDMVGRLSLSHMFESGIPFDSVTGEVYLHDGVIEVVQMDITGSASFEFSGVSDVAQRTLNGELVATLPVAKNLPWVAALAGGLPVAAGVFVVSQIFDKQVNRLTSAVYGIGGTWDDPQVGFNRLFDDRQPRGLSQEQPMSAAWPPLDPQDTQSPGGPQSPGLQALELFPLDPNNAVLEASTADPNQPGSPSASDLR